MPDIALPSHENSWLKEKLLHLFWRLIAGLPDRSYIMLKYWSMCGRFPKIDAPELFSEKIQARKLYDRKPIYAVMVDKHAAKALIGERAGPQYVIPTQWVGRELSTVDWSRIELPVVVKPTHASGCGAFLRSAEDIKALMEHDPSAEWLALRHHRFNREWAYGEFEPQIIIETMLVDDHEVPDDYRFFVFDGRIALIELRLRRNGVGYEAFLDPDWKRLDIGDSYYVSFPGEIPRPEKLEEMCSVAKTIAGDSDFMRVDLYLSQGQVHVGELTLYPGGGFKGCVPDSLDRSLGAQWKQDLSRER
ncbi:MAG: ATP-grasp fold amidoligase family protein [Allorhizobium sp.]